MIGIAMTSYNGEKYLKEQIDSILNQTVSDFELIVCDDVSSDSTMSQRLCRQRQPRSRLPQ